MTLGTFQTKSRIQGDKMDLKAYNGRPLLVRVTEFVPDFSSQSYPQPKPVVFCDVVDLYTSQIFINTLFGAGAVVDNLKDYNGTETVVPVRPVLKNSTKRQGTQYIALEALTDQELAQATQWYEAYWGHVNQTRAQREAAAAVPAAPVAAPVMQNGGLQGGIAQPPTQPQGFAAPVQGGFAPQPQPQAQQFAAPVNQPPAPAPQGFGAPQAPAPASQEAPVNGGGFGQYAPPAAPPAQAPAPQGFGAPQGGGLFTNQPPAPQPGQGFGPPVGDQAAAQAALAHLNQQVQGQ